MFQMPFSEEYERLVLMDMLSDKAALETAKEMLTENSFYDKKHSLLFKNICEMTDAGAHVDQVTLEAYMAHGNTLEKIGGQYALAGYFSYVDSSAMIIQHCSVLLDYEAKRELLVDLTESQGELKSGVAVEEVIERFRGKMDTIKTRQKDTNFIHIKDVMPEVYNDLVEKANSKTLSGVTSGLKSLDRYTDGWQPTDLIIIAAKTSQGKTALALNFALSAAKKNNPALVFSMEMSAKRLCDRLISHETGIQVSGDSLRRNPPTHDIWGKINHSCGNLSNYEILINSTPGMNISAMAVSAKKAVEQHNVKLIIVDYLQLAEGDNKESRQLEVTSVSRGLKRMAMSLKVPVIALSQFSRELDKTERVPKLSDLRESGAIEQDADVVIAIHNAIDSEKMKYPIPGPHDNTREIHVLKNRNGEIGKILVTWNPERVSFYDIA